MNKTDAIRTIIAQCPDIHALDDIARVDIDWTEDKPESYGLMVYGDSTTEEKRYIDSTGVDRTVFNTALFIRLYDETQYNRAENSDFLEKFTKYIRGLNRKKNFPELDGNEKIIKMEAAQGEFYGRDEDNGSGLYSIQLNMIYETKVSKTETIPSGHSIFYNAE